MKKVLFSIAIVAAGLLVASCGNKSEENKTAEVDGQQTEAAATTEEASAGAVAECDHFKVTVPEGWEFNKDTSSENVVNLEAKEFGEFESVYLFFNKEKTSAEEMANEFFAGNESTKQKAEDVTIGGIKFKQLKALESADVNCELFAEVNNGVLEMELSKNIPIDAPNVAKLVESINFK